MSETGLAIPASAAKTTAPRNRANNKQAARILLMWLMDQLLITCSWRLVLRTNVRSETYQQQSSSSTNRDRKSISFVPLGLQETTGNLVTDEPGLNTGRRKNNDGQVENLPYGRRAGFPTCPSLSVKCYSQQIC